VYHFDVAYQEEEWTEQVSRDAQFIAQKLYNVAANSIQKCYDQHGMCPSVAINAPAEFYAYIALQKFKREGDKCDYKHLYMESFGAVPSVHGKCTGAK
jgi:hypothetical protein